MQGLGCRLRAYFGNLPAPCPRINGLEVRSKRFLLCSDHVREGLRSSSRVNQSTSTKMPDTSTCTRSLRKRNKTTTARAPPQRGAYAKRTHAASSAERTGAAPGPADLQRQTPLALTQRTKRTRPAHQTRARLSGTSRCGVVRTYTIFPRASRGRIFSSLGTPPVKASLCVLLAFFTSPPGCCACGGNGDKARGCRAFDAGKQPCAPADSHEY